MALHSSRQGSAARTDRSRSKSIRSLFLAAAGIAMLAGWSTASQATEEFRFSYSGDGVLGSGTLTAEQVAPDTWLALSGTDTTTGGPISGTLSLVTNPNGSGQAYSPSGYFEYDNLLFPNQDPVVDYWGLLFTNGAGGEINLFSYGPDAYTHYDNTGFNVPISFDPSAVPEPASLAVLGGGVLGLAVARRRRTA